MMDSLVQDQPACSCSQAHENVVEYLSVSIIN